jgi:hypothetical protein
MPLDELCKAAVEPLLTHTVEKSELKACRHSIEQVKRVRRRNDGHDETCGCSFTARCIEHLSIKTMTRRRRQVNRQEAEDPSAARHRRTRIWSWADGRGRRLTLVASLCCWTLASSLHLPLLVGLWTLLLARCFYP